MKLSRPNRHVRTATAAGAITLLALGCGSDRTQGAMTADLERDLQLASSAVRPSSAVVSAIEGGPTYSPSGDERGRRDNVVRRRRAPRPTPQATEVQDTPASTNAEDAPAPAVVTAEATPAPAPVPEAGTEAPAARPTWGVIYDEGESNGRGPSDGRGERGERGTGRDGGGWGGIGVIIRGGGAGVDNCEEHDRRAGRRPRGGMGGMGGMGGIGGGVIGGVIGGAIGGAIGGGMGRFPRM